MLMKHLKFFLIQHLQAQAEFSSATLFSRNPLLLRRFLRWNNNLITHLNHFTRFLFDYLVKSIIEKYDLLFTCPQSSGMNPCYLQTFHYFHYSEPEEHYLHQLLCHLTNRDFLRSHQQLVHHQIDFYIQCLFRFLCPMCQILIYSSPEISVQNPIRRCQSHITLIF